MGLVTAILPMRTETLSRVCSRRSGLSALLFSWLHPGSVGTNLSWWQCCSCLPSVPWDPAAVGRAGRGPYLASAGWGAKAVEEAARQEPGERGQQLAFFIRSGRREWRSRLPKQTSALTIAIIVNTGAVFALLYPTLGLWGHSSSPPRTRLRPWPCRRPLWHGPMVAWDTRQGTAPAATARAGAGACSTRQCMATGCRRFLWQSQ